MDPDLTSKWRPFSVLVLHKGQKELLRCPTPGHFESARELVKKGVYAIYRSSTQGDFTLERQLDLILSPRSAQVSPASS